MKRVQNNYHELEEYYELEIINTNGVKAVAYIDKNDYLKVSSCKWTLSIHKDDIRVISNMKGVGRIYLHHFILGKPMGNNVVDHIDRNPLNNRRNNLRFVNHSINSINAKPRVESKSNIRGVYFRKARPGIARASWVCEWSRNGKRHTKSFSIDKYGEAEAFNMACNLRKQKLKEMMI